MFVRTMGIVLLAIRLAMMGQVAAAMGRKGGADDGGNPISQEGQGCQAFQ